MWKPFGRPVLFAGLILTLVGGAVVGLRQSPQPVSAVVANDGGVWRDRTQLLFDKASNRMVRKALRVYDLEPERNLDFYFEPAAGYDLSVGPAITGRGTLTWRIKGAASYDESAVYSRYQGSFKNGRPEGEGKLVKRNGEIYEGGFRNGLYDGKGALQYANGDQYRGTFRRGRPDGKGRYAHAGGEIYEGGFKAGGRQGKGVLIGTDGKRRVAEWKDGKEQVKDGAVVLAQWSDGNNPFGNNPFSNNSRVNPNKVSIAIVTDQARYQRRKAEADYFKELYYAHKLGGDRISIIPNNQKLLDSWKGGGWMYAADDWVNEITYKVPVYLQIGLKNSDSAVARIEGIDIKFQESEADNQPFLGIGTVNGQVECGSWPQTSTNPFLEFTNIGWSDALDSSITFGFTRDKQGSVRGTPYQLKVGRVISTKTTKVNIEKGLSEAGVNVTALKRLHATCPSYDMLEQCGRNAIRTLPLGNVRAHAYVGNQAILTNVEGAMTYFWKDAKGRTQQGRSKFHIPVLLAKIEVGSPAECGGGGPEDPKAGIPVFKLGLNRSNYTLRYPLRRAVSLSRGKSLNLPFGLTADRSSNHMFKVILRFADGQTRESKPISLLYMKPRERAYE